MYFHNVYTVVHYAIISKSQITEILYDIDILTVTEHRYIELFLNSTSMGNGRGGGGGSGGYAPGGQFSSNSFDSDFGSPSGGGRYGGGGASGGP